MNRDQERAIEWDCTKVLTEFYIYIDAGRYEEAVKMYTEDGYWTAGDLETHGRDAICESMRKGMPSKHIQHMVQNIVVNVVDEDHADAVLYATVYRQEKTDMLPTTLSSFSPWFTGRQDNKMVRTSDGWKMAHKNIVNYLQRSE